ncbi:PIN/TRAM domain-containing protein [Inconstantimicrobium mannanitabidum]|uniref:Twitching motility protein PilT n=1 Tax=Inconstantimicrobium mannanitabidum TaxID=1604901 RepID=A0ACB5RI76_9CLOT|nr:PIN domain-containing protein [Clostridium sp. TW13]GKX68793.1 twitching motility protein PilT [Clostridium sp. TW13]
MVKNIFRTTIVILGLVIGGFLSAAVVGSEYFKHITIASDLVKTIVVYVFLLILFGIISFLISSTLYKGIEKLINIVEKNTQKITVSEILFGILGATVALILTTLFLAPISRLFGEINQVLSSVVFIVINLVAVIVGVNLSIKKKDDMLLFFKNFKKDGGKEKKSKTKTTAKVLDTSVIIDGRIFDLCQTGFIEGPLVIPNFVLDELRHVSDSSDALKRNRGRRGLDILNKIQKELTIEVENWEGDFPEIAEVDIKLLKLAQKLGGKVVTNDYNLNKVAEFQGVPVLNINELANAIKSVVLPGEELKLTVVKDGKEAGQGVAYLDDGTMIVVEGGRKFMGEQINAIVTSVLQTAAGRMIFAKQKN